MVLLAKVQNPAEKYTFWPDHKNGACAPEKQLFTVK